MVDCGLAIDGPGIGAATIGASGGGIAILGITDGLSGAVVMGPGMTVFTGCGAGIIGVGGTKVGIFAGVGTVGSCAMLGFIGAGMVGFTTSCNNGAGELTGICGTGIDFGG